MNGPRANLRYVGATTSEAYDLVGIDKVDNQLFFAAGRGILQSSDDGATLSANKGVPANVNRLDLLKKVLRFKGNLYLYARDESIGATKIWRTLPQPGNTAFSWTEVLAHTNGCNTAIGPNLQADDTYIYSAEYGAPTGGPSVWRSTNGLTWTRVLGPVANFKHIHAVAPDPYRPGHVWVTGGDGVANPIQHSTDYGATWQSISADSGWQGVQVSFTETHVYIAGDSARGTVIVIDKTTNTPRFGSLDWHAMTAVPGPVSRSGGGYFTDGNFTSGSKNITSATANFTAADMGRFIALATSADYQVPPDTYIESVTSPTAAVMSKAALGTGTTVKFNIKGDEFYRTAFYGIVDPATGYYYAIPNDSSAGGKVSGIFVLPGLGERLLLLDVFASTVTGEAFIHNGYLWAQGRKHRLLT